MSSTKFVGGWIHASFSLIVSVWNWSGVAWIFIHHLW